MPRDYPRTRRVGEQIRRELAELIRKELDDPRMALVSLTDVEVSRDLAYAKVYLTLLGEASARAEVVDELNRAAGFFRHLLGRRMHIRTIPKLSFIYDDSVERGARLDALISDAIEEDRKRHGEADDAPADDDGR